MLECSGMHQACLWARPLEVDGAESRVFTGSAPDGKRGHRPAPCPGPALDAVLDVPTQRLPRRPGERREAHIGRALGRVAPSMLLCSLSEAICFFLGEPGQPLFARPGGGWWWRALGVGSPLPSTLLSRRHALRLTPVPPGALTPMPAVRTFALTSGFAVVLDFLLQVSAFVALLSLDSRRQEVGVVQDLGTCPAPSLRGWGGLHVVTAQDHQRVGLGAGTACWDAPRAPEKSRFRGIRSNLQSTKGREKKM